MPTDIWKIPLDSDGAVRGSYYLRHHSHVTDTLGTVQFQDGRSVEPVTGRQLMIFVAALGADVDLEPADDAAREAMGASAPVAAVASDPASLPEPAAAPAVEPAPPAETVADTEPAPPDEGDSEPQGKRKKK